MTRDFVESSGTIPIVILSEKSNRKSSNEYNLSLVLSKRDSVPYSKLSHDDKKCDDRKQKILEYNNKCSSGNGEKIDIESGFRDQYHKEHDDERKGSNQVNNLWFTVVF